MFPNDLWQSHLLPRPALGKILIIPGGKGEELPGVQLGSSKGSSHAVLCCAVQGGAHAGTSCWGLRGCLFMPSGPCDSKPVSPRAVMEMRHLSRLHPSEKQGLMPPTHSPTERSRTTPCVLCSFPNSVIQYA